MSADRIKPPATWIKTTNNPPNRNGHSESNDDDQTAPSAIGASRNPATATIRIRSPRKMKTQVAKLVYDPLAKSKRSAAVNESEHEKAIATATADKEFQDKREDLNREVKEIHEMLNEMSKGATNRLNSIPLEAVKLEKPKLVPTKSVTNPIERSKTETNIRPPLTRRNRLKLENRTARSKSATTINTETTSPSQRKKTHNPEETRRYMQEQRKKRRSLQTAFDTEKKPTVDRNEIKKRLEDLRKNTLQIVNKNVSKAKKKPPTGLAKKAPILHRQEEPNLKNAPLDLKLDTDRVSAWTDLSSGKKKVSTERSLDPSPLSENFKKIGLLRKPEIKDHSFNALKDLNMDKENLIIENLTPHLSTEGPSVRSREPPAEEPKKTEDVLCEKKDSPSDNGPWRYQELSRKPDTPVSIRKRSSIPELDLKVPDAKLKSRVSVREKSIQVDTPNTAGGTSKHQPQQQKKAELPYWLKPTSVQVYPYNFIMAVRKKLEAIANPPAVASSSSNEHSSSKQTTNVSANASNTSSSKRKSTENNEKPADKSIVFRDKPYESQLSKSFSEVTSNFSSISIQMPNSSSTMGSAKATGEKLQLNAKKPLRFDEDDTTVSSSVFSSPEKKQKLDGRSQKSQVVDREVEVLSPLSIENISNMQIKSNTNLQNVTLGRGDSFSRPKVESGASSARSEASVDFSQLLDDFNRSLSQVIEVNHQLKTTLVKSHQIFSPEKTKRKEIKSVDLPEYASDFEESSNVEERQTNELNKSSTASTIASEGHTASPKPSESEQPAVTTASSSAEDAIEEEANGSTTENSDEEVQTQQMSHASVEPKTFIVSSDEPAYESAEEKTIEEEVVDGSPQKDNLSMNQFSRDSLELSPREDYIRGHINTSRGDFQCENSEKSVGPPPSYKAPSKPQELINRTRSTFEESSLDSEFVRVFNKSDWEISVMSSNRSQSESTINYSSIGLYEQLIQSETSKSEHLAALLKMREKAIIDRTKGQIAWLEVQKERYKTKGLTLQISAVKKKQRGILLKMEKEREEIKKLLQQTKVQRDHKLRIPEIRPFSDVTLLHQRRTGVQASAVSHTASIYQHHQQQQHHQHKQQQAQWSSRSKSSPIVRGYELETSRSLEQLLQKREEDLRRRREHVERLMEWHRRLDQEEAEVLQLERMLLNCNNGQTHQDASKEEDEKPSQMKMERKLKEIDKSLRELNNITSTDGSTDIGNGGDFVRTSGNKLNKLWRRLTSQRVEKFDPNKRYKLCKSDLEQLYEEAKLAVLHDFGENADVLLAHSSTSTQQSTTSGEVPRLNLNFSSGQSDVDVVRGNYSPCAAQEVFLGFAGTSTSSKEDEREDEPLSKRRVGRSNSSPSLSSLPEMPSSYGNKLSESLANVTSLSKDTEVVSNQRLQEPGRDGEDESAYKSENNVSSQEMTCSSKTDIAEIVKNSGASDSKPLSSCASSNEVSSVKSKTVSEVQTIGDVSSKSGKSGTSLSSSQIHSSTKSHEQQVRTASVSNSNIEWNRSSASEVSSASGLVLKVSDRSASSIPATRNSHEYQSEVKSASSLPSNISEVSTASEKVESTKSVPSVRTKSCQSSLSEEVEPVTDKNQEQNSEVHNSTLSSQSSNNRKSQPSVQQIGSSQAESQRDNNSKTSSIELESCVQSSLKSTSTISGRISEQHSDTSRKTDSHTQLSQSVVTPTLIAEEVASQSDANDETWTAIPSIKSLDHSTNSKHSPNSSTHLIRSNRGEASSIESVVDALTPSTHDSVEEIQRNANKSCSQSHTYERDSEQAYSSEFESSNRIRSSVIISTNEVSEPQREDSDTLANAFYESDFTEAEETNIDDLSMPKLETTANDEEGDESQLNITQHTSPSRRTELENRLIELDVSLKDLNVTFEKALSPERSLSPLREDNISKCPSQKAKESADSALMPDVVNEIELRRRQQVMLENEMKQFEHAVPYMYVREIPNKPPPPYVPPAHGSPMTTIFPSEERIKDITYRRTSELYYEMLNIDTTDENGKKPPSLMDENITNIYERIILDICKEYLTEYESVLKSADPNNFHSPLAFFNPPDRLKCMQDFIYKEVRKSLAMDKNAPKRNQVYSVYGHRGKRDHIGEIIIQEMFEEDDRWCNFYAEEEEVLDLIIDEMIGGAIRDIATEVLETESPNSSPTDVAVAEGST